MKDINIKELITTLQKLSDKGNTTVQINGSLICQTDGNTVIISTDKQI